MPLPLDPLARLALVGGAPDVAACAQAVHALFPGRLPDHPFDAAVRVKRVLAGRGFRDDALVFTLHEMLERRAGNCLGLTLLIGAVLLERGHEVEFVVRLDPFDDVHDAGAEYFARLCHPEHGVDGDSRLPDAGDRRPRFRFAPVEHASIVLPGAGDLAFEANNLVDLEAPPGWAPAAERQRRIAFHQLSAAVWCERAKTLLRRGGGREVWRTALALLARALRGDPDNREAWSEMWQAARLLGRQRLATAAAERYVAAGGDDSLFYFTHYRMTGDVQWLDRALDRLPAYADAYLEKHVVRAVAADDDAREALRRHLAITAWMVAASEVLDLENFYARCGAQVERAFGHDELAALRDSFVRAGG